jgi:hypothetical protein
VGKLWQDATDDEKLPYVAKAALDKARYDADMLS